MASYYIMILIISILFMLSSLGNVNQLLHLQSQILHCRTHPSESNNFVADVSRRYSPVENESHAPAIHYTTSSQPVGSKLSENQQHRCRFKTRKIDLPSGDTCPATYHNWDIIRYWTDMIEQYDVAQFVTIVFSLVLFLSLFN